MRRLHRLLDDGQHVASQGSQIHFITQLGAEGRQCFGRVIVLSPTTRSVKKKSNMLNADIEAHFTTVREGFRG